MIVDSLQDALSVYLLQTGHPIVKTEILDTFFELQKFYFFMCGLNVKVYSDHKPLEIILKKNNRKYLLTFNALDLNFQITS